MQQRKQIGIISNRAFDNREHIGSLFELHTACFIYLIKKEAQINSKAAHIKAKLQVLSEQHNTKMSLVSIDKVWMSRNVQLWL